MPSVPPSNKAPATATTSWSDPLGLYGGSAPKIGGEISYRPVEAAKPASFMSKLGEQDREDLIRTVIAEAAGEGDEGMAGVAAVIRNRSNIRGKSPADVVREPKQFTGYEAPGQDVQKLFNDPAMRERAEKILDGVFTGSIEDPTGGADHYHADYVSPDWASAYPQTKKIGQHIYYASRPSAATANQPTPDRPRSSEAEAPFDALMGKSDASNVPNPEGKGLARLVRPPEPVKADGGGKLNFLNAGQDRIAAPFRSILEETSAEMGMNFNITSGYRSPDHPVEARKKHPGEHSKGTASDISMRGMSPEQRADLVNRLMAKGVRRFGTYSDTPDMLHVDMKDQTGKGTPWFMHDYTTNRMGNAPDWFKQVASGDHASVPARAEGARASDTPTIAADTSFKSSDPMGLYGGKNPIDAAIAANQAAKDEAIATRNRTALQDAFNQDATRRNEQAEALAASNDRYELVDQRAVPDWSQVWETENRSSGRVGDTVRNFGIGAGQTAQGLDNLGRLIVDWLPGGDTINNTLDGIERWMGNGKTVAERRQDAMDKAEASLTPRTQEALQKKVLNDDGSLGPALTDPDWYLAQIARSAPAMVATMGPSGLMARGAYTAALARGATAEVAAATAARTAAIAGGVSEGILGGAETALSIRQAIEKMPKDQLLQTDAVKSLIAGGMSEDEAIADVSRSAQTQGLVFAGVATGAFGGMGDRALAKIIGEGVQGGIVRRTASGAVRGAIGEGIFEELPQSIGQTVAENAAMRGVDPDRSLTQDVAENAIAGLAVGGAMGAGMGGVGGAASRRPDAPAQTTPAQDPSTQQSTARGPLGRAIEAANQKAAERAQPVIDPADVPYGDAPTKPSDDRPAPGSTVVVQTDGLPKFMGTVDSIDGDEILVMDSSTGEMLQVPIADVSKIADSPEISNAIERVKGQNREPLPEVSADPALEPAAPIAGDIKTEMPPKSEQMPATARFPGAPKPGQRVIVDQEGLGRFAARVDSYEESGNEALVTNDQGESYQVPIEALQVSNLTPQQIEAEDLKRNPPIEREIGDAGPNSRKIGQATVVMPDDKHADLYDFARERQISMRLPGGRQIREDGEKQQFGDRAVQKKLAEAFGIPFDAVATIADDYRFRIERSSKDARSSLPIQMNPVNDRLLKRWQAEAQKQQGNDPAEKADASHWWDVSLTAADRRSILDAAGIRRNEKQRWGSFTPAIQKKLERFRHDGEAAPEPQTFTTAKGSVYTVHPDGTTTRDKAERSDPGHEGDKGIKKRSARTIYLETNAAVLSAAGMSGMGSKGARVVIKNGRASLVTWRDKDNAWGVAEGSRNIAFTDKPAEGVYPLELWNPVNDVPGYEAYAGMHAGNPITEIRNPAAAKSEPKADTKAEPKAATTEQDRPTFDDGDDTPDREYPLETIEQIYKDLATRITVPRFTEQLATQKGDMGAAFIDPSGKLYLIKSTANQHGDHAEFFGRMYASNHTTGNNDGYVRISSYNDYFGYSTGGDIGQAAAATLKALKTAAARAGINVLPPSREYKVIGETAPDSASAPEAAASVDDAANEAATSPTNDRAEPTQAQKEAGNYKVGRISLGGLDISIENPAGSERKGVDKGGKAWSVPMKSHYGYIRGTVGRDKDHIDVFVKPATEELSDASPVFVVDQVNADGRFDEHKVMLGFPDRAAAEKGYLENYTAGWKGLGNLTETTLGDFKQWLADGDTTKTFAKAAEPEAAAAPVEPEAKPDPVKWFGTREKAQAHINKNRLGSTHEIIEQNRRFEIHKKQPAEPEAGAAPAALPNATAPEHVNLGVDDRELSQIVAEFKNAHADMMDGDHPVSNVFQPPKKGEIVRLANKVKVYQSEKGWMTVDEAKAEIRKWKEKARAQGTDPSIRGANSDKVVLSLFDLSGEWSRPWEEAGYQVYRFDIQADPNMGDVNNFSVEFFNDWFGDFEGQDVYAVLAACPCTDFAVSGARHFAAKDADGRTVASVKLVHQTLRVIEYFKPSIWAVENPVGRIEELGGLPPWRLSFDPNHLGDPYTKKTLIWGRFNADLPIAPVEPTEGSKMHKLYGGKSQATKNARSVTPEGFSYGFFAANNAHDHPAMALANKFDRLNRSLIEEAIEAGVSIEDIESAVADFYYMEMDDDAANAAIRDLMKTTSPEVKEQANELARLLGDRDIEDTVYELPGASAGDLPAVRAAIPDLLASAAEKVKIRDLALHTEEQWAYVLDADGTAYRMNAAEHDAIGKTLKKAAGPDVANIELMSQSGLALFRLSRGKRGISGSLDLYSMPTQKQAAAVRQIRKALGDEPGMFAIAAHRLDGQLLPDAPPAAAVAADEWQQQAEEALANVPDSHPMKRKWAANVTHGLKSASDRAGVLRDMQDAAQSSDAPKAKPAEKLEVQKPAPKQDAAPQSVTWLNDDFGNWSVPEGTRLRSTSGRELAPSPAFNIETPRKRTLSLQRQRKWLIDEAIKEAERSTTEGNMRRLFSRMQPDNFPRADFDTVNDYLFGDVDGPSAASFVTGPVQPPAPKKARAPAAAKATPAVSENKVFTADAAEKARELLRKKLSQLNSGIDPEIMQAGITLAGYHIERGARTFAAYASAMIGDLGEVARPYLKSWYMGVKYDPRAMAFDGMSSAAEVDAIDVATIRTEPENEPAELENAGTRALEGAPTDPVRQPQGSQDAGDGADGRGRADVSGDERTGRERVSARRGVPDGEGAVSPAAGGRQRAEQQSLDLTPDGAGSEKRPAERGSRVEQSADPLANVQSAATPAQKRAVDHVIAADDGIGEGGAKKKFRANVDAIKILRTLAAEKRSANKTEQASLAKWVGWGGLRPAFYREDGTVTKGWDKEARELKDLLTKEEYAAAESSTRNAHYTSPEVVGGIWSIVRRLGFKGGRALEPSIGAGNFLGLMPADFRTGTQFTGVELDHITGSIAKNLYPSANIQAPMGFEKLSVPDGYFDLAIGNPPFGSERLYDKDRRGLNKFSIHNFFFAKSIDTLRPGGVLAMVVTNRFLDGSNEAARAYIADRAELVGAIRLPNNAFLKNAGTEVTTDIIILRKLEEGEAPASRDWISVTDYRGKDGKAVPLNAYFHKNPDMMLGEFGAFGSMYGPDEPALVARPGEDIAQALDAATRKLPQGIMKAPGAPVEPEQVTVAEGVTDAQIGSMFISPDGSVHIRTPDRIGQATSEPVAFASETAKERVAGMVRVRDAFARLRRAQIDAKATDAQVENLRKRMNTAYDSFVAKHGPINHDVNKRLFRDDPTWPQISALEQSYDKGVTKDAAKKTGEQPKAPSAVKAAIFTKRTQQPYKAPSSASSAKDALALSLNLTGRIDLDVMSRLYGKDADAIVSELGSLVYKAPAGHYETADQYLSGNVKAKLAQAEEAAKTDSAFRRNVAALRDVIPADIEAVDIDVKAGAPWVPAKHVVAFLDHITQSEGGSSAFYSPANAKWDIDAARATDAASTLWATDRARIGAVLNAALNGQTITIYDKTRDGQEVNQPATEAANEKVERVKAEWSRWIWADDARRDELARLYNDVFNTDVVRTYDGAHLSLPGKVGDDIVSLRPHQKAFVWRTLQSSTTLADHTVGAGKTFAAIASAMEKRRIGQAKKPMFVVPNHLVGQWAADFVRLYPGAKVLAATKKDFEAENRKRLFARIATGDWDAVIVAHSSFGRIGIDPEYEARFIQEQMDDLEESIKELRANTGEKSRNVSQLTKWRDNMKAKLERLLDAGKKDDGLTFDELGVDALYVDEAHEFKNLAFATSMTRVAGLGDPSGSQKAADLYMKAQFIRERTGGKNIVFLTGTPISNTMAEMYTVQRYLDGDTLKAMGIAHFDAWARVFGEVVTDWELSPSGTYKLNSRFARFVNLPELMQRYLSFADVITNDDIKRQLAEIGKTLPLPRVKGGAPTIMVVDRSPEQAKYIGIPYETQEGEKYPEGSLVYRAENLPKKAEKGADNMLKVMSDARKAALDMRLINPAHGDYHGSKIHKAADEMVRIYRKWSAEKGTQLVFIDLSTPKKAKAAEEKRIRDLMAKAEKGDEDAQTKLDNMSPDEFMALESPFSVYDDLKDKLIERGIPEAEIAFIHDANTDAQKEELFGKVRSGRVRFLFGSTPKMGAGTNVQNRLVALHHMDAPWRPSDLEQRDGRGIRQGNELYSLDPEGFEIEIMRYATKNTLDARQWQTIEGKAKFIGQLRKGSLKDRTIEDISGEAANAAEMKAAASGNPLILEEMETRRKLKTLQNKAIEHDREQHRIKSRIRSMTEEAQAIEARKAATEKDAADAAAVSAEAFSATFDGKTFTKPKEFGAAMIATMRTALLNKTEDLPQTGQYGAFAISIEYQYDRAFMVRVAGAQPYAVFVQDAADVDPTGLSQRITNTVRKLADAPEIDAERSSKIARELPALEKQIGEWPDAEALADLTAKHKNLLDRLKPQPKKAGQVEIVDEAIDADPPTPNKVPDGPVALRHSNLVSMQMPARPNGMTIREHAIQHIRALGKQTGHEYIVAYDDDGSVVEHGTANKPSSTGLSLKLQAALENKTRKMVVYHNHPSNGYLSPSDIGFLGYPGMHAVWALGHDGNDTRAQLTPEAKAHIAPFGHVTVVRELTAAMTYGNEKLYPFLKRALDEGRIDEKTVNKVYALFSLKILERANIIDIETTNPYDTGLISGLDDQINEHAGFLAKAFFNDKQQQSTRRTDRQPQPLRHIAEVARSSDPTQPDGPGKSAASAADQARSNNDQGQSGLREERARLISSTATVTQGRVVEQIKGKLIDLTPAVLKTIPLNYFTELAQSNMTAVKDYMRVKRSMDAYRGDKHAQADEIAQEWLKYTRLGFAGKDVSRAEELSALMHDATRAGYDPSNPLAEMISTLTGTPTANKLDARWKALPPKGKELFVRVRQAYEKQAKELDDILLDNVRKSQQIALDRAEARYKKTMQKIRDNGLTGLDKRKAEEDAAAAYKAETTKAKYAGKARLTKMRIAFESSRLKGPYFPLGRFGRYFVTVRDSEGKVVSFSKFEKAVDRDRAAKDLASLGNGKYSIEKGVMEDGGDLRKAMDPRIVAEIEEILGGAGVSGDIMDQIWQRYLESMPDLSTRKSQIHRKGTHGYNKDALRVFSSHMFHASHQMARLKYGLELQELVNVTMDQAKEAADPTAGVTLANELTSRHDWVMNPTGSSVAQTMTSAAFVWYLASSPASAMVNLTQTVMMGVPILGAKFGGMAKATAAIGRASLDSVHGKGNVANGNLTEDEQRAMAAFYASGLIDRTQSHDLAGVGDTGVRYSPLRSKIMGVISWAFHRAEVWNREVTALAAYRLARDAGQNQSDAIDSAHDLTWKTHFDYSNSSRPAVLQNDFAKVAMVFRQHNINMLYRVFRDVHQSLQGQTPQARKEARYQLAGVVGMMTLMAGVTGTIGFNLLMGILGMAFGDDDDPLEFTERFKANVVEILGPELGGIVLNGAPGHYLGVDLSNRIGMPDLWFRSPNRELQGKEEFQYWVFQGLGASVSMGEALWNGFSVMTDEGEVARGLEIMAPKAIRDLMKAYRYTDEGLTTINGDEIMSTDEMGPQEILAQAMGFTPASVAERWERSSALKNAERSIRERRQRLINQWAMAQMSGDAEGKAEALEGMKAFNKVPAHRGVPITRDTLERSLKTRVRNKAKREDGVLIQNRDLARSLRDQLADPIYK